LKTKPRSRGGIHSKKDNFVGRLGLKGCLRQEYRGPEGEKGAETTWLRGWGGKNYRIYSSTGKSGRMVGGKGDSVRERGKKRTER